MKITVDIPDQISLGDKDSITLIVDGMVASVTVHGNGKIEVRGNGGGAASFTVDVRRTLENLRDTVQIKL